MEESEGQLRVERPQGVTRNLPLYTRASGGLEMTLSGLQSKEATEPDLMLG